MEYTVFVTKRSVRATLINVMSERSYSVVLEPSGFLISLLVSFIVFTYIVKFFLVTAF